jgi:hypothetical protein
MRNARCVATGDSPFFINFSTIKARCSPDHVMVYTENGTYTAVQRRAPHHCMRSQPEAMPLPNRGVLSAALYMSLGNKGSVALDVNETTQCRLIGVT